MTVTKQRGMGWVPDLPDHRDFYYSAAPAVKAALPDKLSLRGMCPPVYDQGAFGSCTAQMGMGMVQFTEKEAVKGKKRPVGARMALYYWTRLAEGNQDFDSGATIRGTFKTLAKMGYCGESHWKYTKANLLREPTPAVAKLCVPNKLTSMMYARVPQILESIQATLVEKNPIGFGMTLYESFMSAAVRSSGLVPYPSKEEKVVGGHAMTIVGYDNLKKAFEVRNSWGVLFGDQGYVWIPYSYILNMDLTADLWTLRAVTPVEETF